MKLNRKRVPISDFGIFYYLKVELIPSINKGERFNFIEFWPYFVKFCQIGARVFLVCS